jgi:uncharacterized protein YndB with AHSA1/START domain
VVCGGVVEEDHMSDIVISIEVEEVIAAPIAIVYDLISDLTRMGEWSPENLGSVWVEGPPASVGSRFMGRNRKGVVEWEGGGVVITASRPTEIAWAMGDDPDCPRGTWRYLLTDAGGVTRVVEHYELGPGPSGFRDSIAERPVADQPAAIAGRRDELHRAMQTTLARLKAHAENL